MLQFVPASGSHGDSGPHHDCGFAYRLRSIRLLVHFLTLQKRKSPTVLSAGLETKALTHRWDKINTDSGKVNSPQQNRRLSLQALPRYLLKLFFCPCLFNIEFRNQLIIERFNGLLPRIGLITSVIWQTAAWASVDGMRSYPRPPQRLQVLNTGTPCCFVSF